MKVLISVYNNRNSIRLEVQIKVSNIFGVECDDDPIDNLNTGLALLEAQFSTLEVPKNKDHATSTITFILVREGTDVDVNDERREGVGAGFGVQGEDVDRYDNVLEQPSHSANSLIESS